MAELSPHSNRGSVLIVTLWTVTLLVILVTVIAANIRLSAQAAYRHQEELGTWARVMGAVNQAQMELVMERMPPPPESLEDLSQLNRNPAFRFNGQALNLHYPVAEDISVRIYDHAGKINLREISRPRLRMLLEKRLGRDQQDEIDALLAAWGDWSDLNRGVSPGGAEDDYYQSLEPAYLPRNGRLESVEELLAIRGFAEVFAGVNMEAAFTLYGGDEFINLNLATREAMELLPGLDEADIEAIIAWRQQDEFRTTADVGMLVEVEKMVELAPWLNNQKISDIYTIVAYQTIVAEAPSADALPGAVAMARDITTHAYAETVQITDINNRPRVLRVNPYQALPRFDPPLDPLGMGED